MRKTILLIFSLFVVSLTVSARSISQAEAQSVATSFVNGLANKGTTKLKHVGVHQVKAANASILQLRQRYTRHIP